MHELSITQSILDYSLSEAKKHGGVKIREIRLLLGLFSGIVPECIQMYMDLLAEGTIAQGVKIKATTLPLKVRCRDCGKEFLLGREEMEWFWDRDMVTPHRCPARRGRNKTARLVSRDMVKGYGRSGYSRRPEGRGVNIHG